jgi:hypothetical protein
LGTLNVKKNAVINVKGSGTLEVNKGSITVDSGGTITVQDDGKITFGDWGGTINVEGTITLGSAEMVGDDPYYPEDTYRIAIGNEGSITGGGASNFCNEDGTPITGDITTGTYEWDDDTKKWQKQ